MTLPQLDRAWLIRASLIALGVAFLGGGFFLSLGPAGTTCAADSLGSSCLLLGSLAMTGYLAGALLVSFGTIGADPLEEARQFWGNPAFSGFSIAWLVFLFVVLTWFLVQRVSGPACPVWFTLPCLGGIVLAVLSGCVTFCLAVMGSVLIPPVERALEGDWNY